MDTYKRSRKSWLERGSALKWAVRMLYLEACFMVVVCSQLFLQAGSGVSVWQHWHIPFWRALFSLHTVQKAWVFLSWVTFPKLGNTAVKTVIWKPSCGHKCSNNLEEQCLNSSSQLNVFCWSTLVDCLVGCVFPSVALTFQIYYFIFN